MAKKITPITRGMPKPLPPNKKLEQLRREGKTLTTQNKLSGKTKPVGGAAAAGAKMKAAKPYTTGADFRSKLTGIGGAAASAERAGLTKRGK